MSKRGPVPKENPVRRNDGPAKVLGEAPVDAPELPGADGYLPQTLEWYRTWATSPQASLFAGTDWQRLHMLAPLVDLFWQSPSKELMAEIRQNESKLGGTTEDRQRLRMKIEPPAPPAPPADEEKDAPQRSRARKDPRT